MIIETLSTAGGIGEEDALTPIAMPLWLRRVKYAGLLFAVMGIGLSAGLAAEILTGRPALAMALFFALLALMSGVAVLVARMGVREVAGRAALLSQAIAASPNAHLIVAADGSITYANSAFRRFFPEIRALPLEIIALSLAGDEAAKEFQRLETEAVERGRASGRLAIRRSAGATLWFVVSASLLPRSPGFMLWSFEDITQRQEMERAIQEEETTPAEFLDSSATGFYSVDGDGRFLLVNQTLADWFGQSPGELMESGAALTDFIVEDGPLRGPPYAPFAGGGEGAQRGELVLRGTEGRLIYASVSQSVVRAGDKLRTRSVVRDLTSQHEWAEALKRSRLRFQRLFANAPVGIALLGAGGRIEEANRALGELLGAPAVDLIGRELTDFVIGEDRAQVDSRIAAAGQGPARPVDARLLAPREIWASLFLSRLEGEDEAGLVLHVIDTTEQKSLEAQFAQSQKMQAVGQLAGGVAHDFNNLLTAMIGFCDLLLVRFKPGDPSFADIMQIKQNANRAANLVRQLLAFSRQQTLQPTVLNLTEVLAELSNLLRRLIGEKIELQVVHGRDLGLVEVDQGQIEQVVINLAVNARDAMPNGGALTIRTANATIASPLRRGAEVMPPGQYVLIEVSDTGFGIPKENLTRIFEPFFSTKEVGTGTGLGLSTVYGIVKQTGGFVFIDSEPGKGAQFSIYLPRKQGKAAAVRPVDNGDEAGDLTGTATVLLVEDEDPVRLFSARALRNKGYRVIEAKSGEGALEIVDRGAEQIDLIISDVVMPRMDGPEMAAKVREQHPDMKVIFISGYTEEAFRDRLTHDVHFLPKPYNLKQLAAKVKQVLETADPEPMSDDGIPSAAGGPPSSGEIS
ncbi:MAG TPA: PAS domain S-box protein [Stellaceae bacterium]|nr:PAS domain S-box protein [Stellaceae bacterium]